MLTPSEFGLPPHFGEWRPSQWDAVNQIVDSQARFVALCAPTGFGKSLVYMAAAHLSGMRTIILTSTKGLQDQLNSDFDSISRDIRGMPNYVCDATSHFGIPSYTRVSEAPCQAGAGCVLKNGGCQYYDLFRECQEAPIVVTNYQNWLYDVLRGKQASGRGLAGVKPVDVLVLDECHDATEELSSFLSTELERKECMALGVSWPISGYVQKEWQEWARYWLKELSDRIDDLQEQLSRDGYSHSVLHEIRDLRALTRKLERVEEMTEEWLIEELEHGADGTMRRVKFDPIWPRSYAERYLFRGVKKIVLTSATVRPKTLELLGVPQDSEELEFTEYPSSFPKERRPVIHVPTVRVNYRTEQDDGQMMWWLRRIDQLIERRLDRKGVVHTVSYKRARFLYDNSRHRDRMLVHGSDNRAGVIERFKGAGAGTVLVSPSVDTGYDFHGELAEYQIIGKLPFQDTRETVMKARTREDKDYGMYLTAQTLQQMTGRIMRSAEDRGETLIVDDNVAWFVGKYRRFLNGWWTESYRKAGMGMPTPPPKL